MNYKGINANTYKTPECKARLTVKALEYASLLAVEGYSTEDAEARALAAYGLKSRPRDTRIIISRSLHDAIVLQYSNARDHHDIS